MSSKARLSPGAQKRLMIELEEWEGKKPVGMKVVVADELNKYVRDRIHFKSSFATKFVPKSAHFAANGVKNASSYQ